MVLCVSCGPRERFDLDAIKERGTLRIIAPRLPDREFLPRAGYPIDYGRTLAEQFARSLELEPEIVWVRSRDEMEPALLRGRGDLIAANLTVTASRRERMAFSEPVDRVREQLVSRIGDDAPGSVDDLDGRTIALRPSSSYWQTAEELKRAHPGIEIRAVSERLGTEEILYRVSTGRYDLTIADNNIVEQALSYMPGLRVAFDVGDEKGVAWGLRPDATELKVAADSFVRFDAALPIRQPLLLGDLESIRARGVLRVLTTNSAATYFVWRGELMGFEYELAHEFADRLGVQLEVVVPPSSASMVTWLLQGHADFIAAGWSPTPERADAGIEFSRPYNYAVKTLVGRVDDPHVEEISALEGRTIAVRQTSSYWDAAMQLRESVGLNVVAVPAVLETAEIIDSVAAGTYDLTIADSHILEMELTARDDVHALATLGDTVPHEWAFRAEDSGLRNAADGFIRSVYRGRWYNITRNRYFRNTESIQESLAERVSVTGAISPYDDLFRQYGERFGFDWRLLAAQSFAESRFDSLAISRVGAIGLMQIMPATARAFGFDNPRNPDQGVHMGALYLNRQVELFGNALDDPSDRLWFGLASYNAGFGHVGDARRLAASRGLDPDRWFGHVESVMPLLARAEYHSVSRYGYCRCSEPVNYVRKIRDTFAAYSQLVPAD